MQPRLQQILAAGESRTVEFKRAAGGLGSSLYETICAFLNRDGGDILLGVADNGSVIGLDPEHAAAMMADFANTINNPNKISPPCFLNLNPVEIDGETILHLLVPPSSQVHRCNGRIFDRNEEGDYDITANQDLVYRLYLRKQSSYSENRIYPYVPMSTWRI